MLAHRYAIPGSAVMALLVLAPDAPAKSMGIRLQSMIRLCDDIAIARYADAPPAAGEHRVTLVFTEILKGNLSPGRHTVVVGQQPTVGGPEFIAFCKAGLCWRFAAAPLLDGPLAETPLNVWGFLDDNAYHVAPSVVTLKQLRGLLKDSGLAARGRGTLHFPRKGADGTVVGADLDILFDGLTGKAEVRGLPDLPGFAGATAGFPLYDGKLIAELSDNSGFPLSLAGRVTGLDTGGDLTAEFIISDPDILSMGQLREYAADPRRGRPVQRLKVEGAPHPLVLGDWKSRDRELEGWPGIEFRNTSCGFDGRTNTRVYDGGGTKLEFEFPVSVDPIGEQVARPDFADALVFALWRKGRISGHLTHSGGLSDVVVSLDGCTFTPLDKPRTDPFWHPQKSEPASTFDGGVNTEQHMRCGPDEGALGHAVPAGTSVRWWVAAFVVTAAVLAAWWPRLRGRRSR